MNTNKDWKLVPVEPTDEMETAAENDYEQTGATFPRWKSAYAAMIAAAPSCLTCGGHGMIGGPSFYAPDEGGEPCPDCSPASTVATEGEKDERQADACPRCDGRGEITVMSDNSPDAHDVVVFCDHCQGSGAATDAAKYLAAALSGEKYRHMQLWAEYRNFHRSLSARFGYGHDEVHFRRDLVSLEEAIAAKVAAPAAGDAQGTVTLVTRPGRAQELFTYSSQPCDNVIAWRIGEACSNASRASAGDYIDRGLGLLKELQAKGYGIAALAASQQQEG